MADMEGMSVLAPMRYLAALLGAVMLWGQWWLCIITVMGGALMDPRFVGKAKMVGGQPPNSVTPESETITSGGEKSDDDSQSDPELLGQADAESGQEQHTASEASSNINPAPPADSILIFSPTPTKRIQPLKFAGDITDSDLDYTNTIDISESSNDDIMAPMFERDSDIGIERQPSQQSYSKQPQPIRRLSNLASELNTDNTAVSEMESIQRELAAALGFPTTPSPRGLGSLQRNGSTTSLASLLDRPRNPLFAPPTPGAVEDIVSMEFLEDSTSTKSVPSTPPQLSRSSTISSVFSNMSRTPSFRDELAAFSARAAAIPTIDDVLSVYEASIAPSPLEAETEVEAEETQDVCDIETGAMTSGDESLHDGVFSDDEDDVSVVGSPAGTSIDGGDRDMADVEELDTKTKQLAPSPIIAVPVRRKQTPPPRKKRSKKNNGHKTVPKKHRLSGSDKKRFVSKAFW